MSDDVKANKLAAVDFLQLAVSGKIDEAFDKYVDMRGKHHDPFFGAGFPALKQAMIDLHVQTPNAEIEVKNVLGDSDLVAVHSRVRRSRSEPAAIVVHLFRLRAGKIVEFWDCGQAIPADSPNKNGAF